jgi:putative FmdB family regulatory protein
MPTYEYKCRNGHVFEKFYPAINANRRVKCPSCGKLAERQISGGAGLVFKGSGFYITDYKRAGEKQEQTERKEETKPATESKPAAETKPVADTKPADSSKKKKDSGDK